MLQKTVANLFVRGTTLLEMSVHYVIRHCSTGSPKYSPVQDQRVYCENSNTEQQFAKKIFLFLITMEATESR